MTTLRKLQNLQNRHFSLMALQNLVIFVIFTIFVLFAVSSRAFLGLIYFFSLLFDKRLAKFRYFCYLRNFRSTLAKLCDFCKFRNRVQSWTYFQDEIDNKKTTTILTNRLLVCFIVQTHLFCDTFV